MSLLFVCVYVDCFCFSSLLDTILHCWSLHSLFMPCGIHFWGYHAFFLDTEWYRAMQSDRAWNSVVQSGAVWYRVIQGGTEWYRLVQHFLRFPRDLHEEENCDREVMQLCQDGRWRRLCLLFHHIPVHHMKSNGWGLSWVFGIHEFFSSSDTLLCVQEMVRHEQKIIFAFWRHLCL